MDVWKSDYKSKQGNAGLGAAIAYYTSIGVPTAIPLNDTQKYDLIVEQNNLLQRVSVKTTQQKNKNNKYFVVQLRNTGGSSGKSKIRLFDPKSCDILFILTKDGTTYEIPTEKIKINNLFTLTDEWNSFIVKIDYGTSAQNENSEVEEG